MIGTVLTCVLLSAPLFAAETAKRPRTRGLPSSASRSTAKAKKMAGEKRLERAKRREERRQEHYERVPREGKNIKRSLNDRRGRRRLLLRRFKFKREQSAARERIHRRTLMEK